MTIEAFENLAEDQKLKVLMKAGSVMSERKEIESRSFLYCVNAFYVIVKYNSQTDDLLGIKTFNEFDRKERIDWKILRVLPELQRTSRGKVDGFL